MLFRSRPTTGRPAIDQRKCVAVASAVKKFLETFNCNLILPTFHAYKQHDLHGNSLAAIDATLAVELVNLGFEVTPVPLQLKRTYNQEEWGALRYQYSASLLWVPPFKEFKELKVSKRTCLVMLSTMQGSRLDSQDYIEHMGNGAHDGFLKYYFSGLHVKKGSAAQSL